MQITATEAKNRFGYFCAQAKTQPVVVEKDGRPDSVIVSYESFRAMKDAAEPKTPAQRQREFNEKHKDWFAAQNEAFDSHGIWCDGLVAWQMPGESDGAGG